MRTFVSLAATAVFVMLLSGCAQDDQFWNGLITPQGSAPTASSAATATTTVSAAPELHKLYTYCASCLVDADGKAVATSTTVNGDLEQAELRDGMIVLKGWAADGASAAKAVLLVSDAGVVGSAIPNLARPDVAAALKVPETTALGYEISAPADQVGASALIWIIGAAGQAARLKKVFRR
jgi:hypothetical protein